MTYYQVISHNYEKLSHNYETVSHYNDLKDVLLLFYTVQKWASILP